MSEDPSEFVLFYTLQTNLLGDNWLFEGQLGGRPGCSQPGRDSGCEHCKGLIALGNSYSLRTLRGIPGRQFLAGLRAH